MFVRRRGLRTVERMSTSDEYAARIREFAAGAQGPPLLESEILLHATRVAKKASAEGQSAVRVTMAVMGVLTDERFGYERFVRLADIALALDIDVPRGTIDEATERGRAEARRRAHAAEGSTEDIGEFPYAEPADPWDAARRRQRAALERSDVLVDRESLERDEAWGSGGSLGEQDESDPPA